MFKKWLESFYVRILAADVKKQVLPQQVEDILNKILNKGESLGSALGLNDAIAEAMESDKRFIWKTYLNSWWRIDGWYMTLSLLI